MKTKKDSFPFILTIISLVLTNFSLYKLKTTYLTNRVTTYHKKINLHIFYYS